MPSVIRIVIKTQIFPNLTSTHSVDSWHVQCNTVTFDSIPDCLKVFSLPGWSCPDRNSLSSQKLASTDLYNEKIACTLIFSQSTTKRCLQRLRFRTWWGRSHACRLTCEHNKRVCNKVVFQSSLRLYSSDLFLIVLFEKRAKDTARSVSSSCQCLRISDTLDPRVSQDVNRQSLNIRENRQCMDS